MKLVSFFFSLLLFSCSSSLEDYKKMDESVRGKQIFQDHCMQCHGMNGADGPENSNLQQSTLSDQEIIFTIRNGRDAGMPAHTTEVFNDEACMKSLVEYVKSLRK